MSQLRNATLLFLVKKTNGQIVEICLAMKKMGFGTGKWNGVGGKVEINETIEEAAVRETKEEIGVDVLSKQKVAELSFYFPHNSSFDQKVHVYICEQWNGEPLESEEMAPKWFDVVDIPFASMWPGDVYWLPRVLSGGIVEAKFVFGEGDSILEKEINLLVKNKI